VGNESIALLVSFARGMEGGSPGRATFYSHR
jgi:hypothetical protein